MVDRSLPDEAIAALNRFVAHIPQKGLDLIVLKAHLLIELQLRDIVRKHAAPSELPKMERATFWTLTRVARALVGTELPDERWDAIDTLNQLRNKIAHQLNSPKVEALATRFVELMGGPLTPELEEPLDELVREAAAMLCGSLWRGLL